ncbi:type II toxin-antitoxin system RelE/ParE family toxin [Patescibacteria group bacterium]|nr:type II toxin-antitoxin system RelE/ParE family toxin [Patescibacteria group bacterium]MCG2700829.1 type II toxin-antitoxin system RelE/ParE family toxin [Candidatus Parcubacteria bacterium]
MYNFVVVNSCKKDFKKLSRDAQKFIRHTCFPIILKNPFAGEKLKGREFQGILKFSVRFKSADYRIVYQFENEKLIIIFVMIASRENFYKKLKNRI